MPSVANPLKRTLSQSLSSKKGTRQKVESELDPYTDWARWVARTENPFVSINAIFHIGMKEDTVHRDRDANPNAEQNGDVNGDRNANDIPNGDGNQAFPADKYLERMTEQERQHYLKLWRLLLRDIPTLEQRLPDYRLHPEKLNNLTSAMMKAVGEARSQDAHSLREKILAYVAACLPTGNLEPPIKPGAKKSDTRGWKHPMLARLLCPIQYLEQFDEDPQGTIDDLEQGRIPFTADDFPAFTYAEGTFDPDNAMEGLFMHPLPIQVAKHLLCCPSAALKPAGTTVATKPGQAKRHELVTITERIIAYCMFQTAWGICSQDDLRMDEGQWIKELFFNAVVDTLTAEFVDKVWVRKICDHWTMEVLGPGSKKTNQVARAAPSIRDAIRTQQQHALTVVASGIPPLVGASSRTLNPGRRAATPGGWDAFSGTSASGSGTRPTPRPVQAPASSRNSIAQASTTASRSRFAHDAMEDIDPENLGGTASTSAPGPSRPAPAPAGAGASSLHTSVALLSTATSHSCLSTDDAVEETEETELQISAGTPTDNTAHEREPSPLTDYEREEAEREPIAPAQAKGKGRAGAVRGGKGKAAAGRGGKGTRSRKK